MIIKRFCKAGEETAAIPLYLCQQTRERLKMWQRLPVEEMREELRQDIEQLNRFEFLALDDAGTLKAMMIIDADYNPHYGSYLYPRYAFSTDKGRLIEGYQWLKELTRSLKYDGYVISRQTGEYEITSKFKRLNYE
ncbi:hypothetical protein G6K72_000828 [Salmonella enterica subsp. enterica serovar Rubislaw]|nr:hypothetical protein [Salmonella enterica subsp. enterica serovar Rubislaw]